MVQALLDRLIERGVDAAVCRLIIDSAKALSKVIRRTFGSQMPIQLSNHVTPATR